MGKRSNFFWFLLVVAILIILLIQTVFAVKKIFVSFPLNKDVRTEESTDTAQPALDENVKAKDNP
jgi:hypothetical protein